MTDEEFFGRLEDYGLEHNAFIYTKPLYDHLKKHPSVLESKKVLTSYDIIGERDRYSNVWERAFQYWKLDCEANAYDPCEKNKEWMEAAERIKNLVHDDYMDFYNKEWELKE